MWITETTFWGATIRISPRGAKTLLQIYNNGDLILQKGKVISEASEIVDYINKEAYFKKKVDEMREKIKRERMLIECPEKIKEEDFTYELLDEVFYKVYGPIRGEKTIILDGIKVTKVVSVYKSNTAKSQDSEVRIRWIDSNGKIHEYGKNSMHKGNRRNDPNRNWGLPE